MNNVAILGDCMNFMRTCADKQFDLAIVDPPYGIGMGMRLGRHSKGQRKYTRDNPKYKISQWDDEKPNKEYFTELVRVSKNQIVWGANHFIEVLTPSRGWVFWDKHVIIPNYSAGELAWTSFDCVLRKVSIHWNGKIRTGIEPEYKSIHPTQKPKKLYKWLLKNYAKPGDKILDTHLGSGSSRIAAYEMGFDFTGIEIDPDYFAAQEKRFKNHIAQLKIFQP